MLNPDAYFFNYYAIPNIVVSSLIFATGFFVFLQNPKSASNIFFFLFCLSLNLWLYGRAIMYCSKSSETALFWAKTFAKLGVFNIAPLVYTFSVHWLGLYEKQKKLVIASFIGAFFFYFVTLLTPYGLIGVRHYFWGYYPVYGPICKVFLVFFFGYFLTAFYNFFTQWRKAKDPIRHQQIKVVTLAYMISFTGAVDFLPKIMNFPMYPFGYLSVCIWTFIMGYAIVRYRTMDIQTVIHKTIMWVCSTVVTVLPFAYFVDLTKDWILRQNPGITTFYFLIVMLTFYFYFRAIQPRLDHLFRRRNSNLQTVLTRFSSDLAHLKNLRELLQGFVRMIRRTLYTRQISVYLKDAFVEQLNPAIAKRVRGLKPVHLDDPFLTWLEKKDEVVIGDLAKSNPEVESFKENLLDYFNKTEAAIVVPLIVGGKLIGTANLGPKENLRRYTSEEIQFLTKLKSSVSIAFANSLQFIAMQESLQKWNDELEKKVVERTAQLQDTQAQLVQAEKLATIGTLAGGVAHEINNPLTAVLTNAQILKMSATNQNDMESLELIEEGAKRCQVIVQKLMKYSRKPIESEVMAVLDINKVVDNTAAFLTYQLKQDNIQLVIEKTMKTLFIKGSGNELEQVLTNLIINAKDAIKQLGKNGIVKILTIESNKSAEIIVEDNGIGIPQANLNKIFDPFYTTKDVGKGTGLGLAVTYEIVKKHKGEIRVTSEIQKGTRFSVLLPKVED